jgi:hypothetical protein
MRSHTQLPQTVAQTIAQSSLHNNTPSCWQQSRSLLPRLSRLQTGASNAQEPFPKLQLSPQGKAHTHRQRVTQPALRKLSQLQG